MKNKFFVVIVHRDRSYQPKLSVTVEKRVPHRTAGNEYIKRCLFADMIRFGRSARMRHRCPHMRVFDYRVVDAEGLKRLRAAAKASATLRRRRAAKKGWVTRALGRDRRDVEELLFAGLPVR